MAYSQGVKRFAIVLGLLTSALASRPAGAFNFDWSGAVDVDAEGLDSDLPKNRLDAVTALLGHDISLTKDRLLDRALHDDEITVRHAAAKGLGAGGVVEAVPLMIDWLADIDPKTRIVAADALGDIGGADATAALVRSLGDIEPVVRQHAVRSLGAIGKRGNVSVVIAIIPRLDDDKVEVKREAIEQLESLGDRRAVIPLVGRFTDGTPGIVTAAVRAIGKLGDRSAVPALTRLLNDSREDIKTAAVASLGQLGALDALDALTEQLAVGSQAYRDKVAYALGQIAAAPGSGKAGEDAMRTLVASLADPTKRRGAREALAIAGKAAVPALVLHLEGRLPGDPTTAVELLAAAADPRATAALTSELERSRVPMPTVLRSLGATADPAALVPMLGALTNKDATIRLAAMDALRPILGRDARAGDVLVEHLADEDPEIRVLAAEYLGILATPSATPRLIALSGPGNPPRLRLASIDALGQISAATHAPTATTQLLAILKEGAPELHRAAAAALAYATDPAALPALIALVEQVPKDAPTRAEIVRALGATLRAHHDPAGIRALGKLVKDGNVRVALAAIAGLASADATADAATLRGLVDSAAADRQRAAVWALGELHDVQAIDVIGTALTPRADRLQSDRLAGDAAWALGEIVATSGSAATNNKLATLLDRWLYATQFGGWAAAVNGTGAVARVLVAIPAAQRAQILGAEHRKSLLEHAAFHKSRLVRLNAIVALAALDGDDVTRDLVAMAQTDPSPHVRAQAATALATRVGSASVKTALAAIADTDADGDVKAAAKAALVGAKPVLPRTDWRNFYVVDPSADDAAVRQEPYFVHTSDGLVWATYTDARGEIASEHLPADTTGAAVHPGSRELEY